MYSNYGLVNRRHLETADDRKSRYKVIGENVYSFFQDVAIESGFEEREGQWDMSCEIVDGIRDKKHVLVEASVGIGKSFAYIVPLLYYHQIYKKPIAIATSTIALQEQLKGDIETIMDMLDYKVEVIIAKGQNHFLCKNRFFEYFTDKFIDQNEEHKEIYKSVKKQGYEKASWNIQIPDYIWNKINVKEFNQRFCREKCNYKTSCYYYNLRQKMLSTNGIIVCNQDLLASNMHKKSEDRNLLMNEEIGLVVIDEVHNLESRVRSSVTSSLSIQEMRNTLNAVGKSVDAIDNEFVEKMEYAENLLKKFFLCLQNQMNEQDQEAEKNNQEIDRYYIKRKEKSFSNLEKVLEEIHFRASIEFGDFVGDKIRKNYDAEIQQLEDYVSFLKSLMDIVSNHIFWLERKGQGIKEIRIYRCPKEVDKITKEIIFNDKDIRTILTSATITSGKNAHYINNYSYFIKNVGFPDSNGLICEPKESPFLYDDHAMIYYTEHMPHPTKQRDKFIEEGIKEIIKLLKISNGKALILFTAKADMKEVYNKLLDENLPYEILMQTDNSNQAELLGNFKSNVNSVLLGAGTFWEGINIEGMALSHLIIFKLPFPVREPIIDYKWEISKDGLMEVSVPEMVIKLKQGIGRLIRSQTDRGIVSIIDSRVGDNSKAPYKEIIWNSLPIKNRTNDINKINEFYKDVCMNKTSEVK